jgi:hypothetical protein
MTFYVVGCIIMAKAYRQKDIILNSPVPVPLEHRQPVQSLLVELLKANMWIFSSTIHEQIHRAISTDFDNVKPPFEIIHLAQICEHYSRKIGI